MPERSSKPKKRPPADVNALARFLVDRATGEPTEEPARVNVSPSERNPAAVALGRLGGLKGGNARAAALTPARKKAIAKKAAAARWGKQPPGR